MRPFVLRDHFYLPGQTARGKSLTSAAHHLDYMQNPKKEELVQDTTMESAGIHARYMGERPGSAGLFGPIPGRTPPLDALENVIKNHDGPVWRWIPSVTGEDALELGLMDRRRWEQVARHVMPQAAKIMGIDPGNLAWVAAMHRKEGHPHLHILFWEKVPHREKGVIKKKKLADIRHLWMKELYRPRRQALGAEKSAVRQQAREAVQSILTGDASIHIPPPFLKEFAERLSTLADHMPGHGRAALKYMPPEVKTEAQSLTQWLLQQHPDLARLSARYGDIAAEMAQHYSDDPAQHQKARQNAQADLTDRMGQLLIQQAAALDKEVRWDFVRATIQTDDPHVERELHRMSRLHGEERKQAIHDYAETLRGDRPESKYQRPLERRIEKSLLYIEEARRQQAAHSLRGVFFGLQAALRQAEAENRREATKRRWGSAKE
jgi:hypothetical protein